MKGLLKQNIQYTRWEKAIHKILVFFFKEEIEDLIADARGDGFADGYQVGFKDSQLKINQGQIDLYELGYNKGKTDLYNELKSFNPDSVVKVSGNRIYLGKNELKESEAKALKEEVKYLKSTKIWDLFFNTVVEQARATMFNLSETFDDMKTGKLMLLNLSILEKLCSRIENYNSVKKQEKPNDYGRIAIDSP